MGLKEDLQAEFENLSASKTAADAAESIAIAILTWVTGVPVGSIVPWHKSFTNTPALPDGWLELNGQTVSDSDSPYDGQTLPNLNDPKNAWNSAGSFIRGGNTSGAFEDDEMQGHFQRFPGATIASFTAGSSRSGVREAVGTINTDAIVDDGTNGVPRVGAETKSVAMTMVWIMRIK